MGHLILAFGVVLAARVLPLYVCIKPNALVAGVPSFVFEDNLISLVESYSATEISVMISSA
jgi:hypothetical protein